MDSSIGEILLSGAKLMLVGMGIVYLFLALLVWVIGLNFKLIQRFSTDNQGHLPHPPQAHHASDSAVDTDAELVAVISAAIHHHQNN